MQSKTAHILTSLNDMIASEVFKEAHRTTSQSFIRNRILGFAYLVKFQLNLLVKSLSVELTKAFKLWGFDENISYSKQAFSQARQKLKPSAFVSLNQTFVSQYYQQGDYRLYQDKFLLVAVDGSLLQLPDTVAVGKHFGQWKNQTAKGMNMGRCSVLYDLLNEVVIASDLQSCATGEHALYERHLKMIAPCFEDTTMPPKLYLMDRNYPSFKKMLEIPEAGDSYVIRCKEGFCPEVSAFVKSNESEAILTFQLDKKRMRNNSLKHLTDTPQVITTRIVRLLLPDNTYEYLLTNTNFPPEELYTLYQLRWGVEGYYFLLKERMQLENFTAKTVEGVQQDFFAKVLTANICKLLIEDAQQLIDTEDKESSKKNQYTYIINTNVALGLIKDDILVMLKEEGFNPTICEQLIQRIKKHKVAVRPGRTFPRYKQKRSKRKFFSHQRSGI